MAGHNRRSSMVLVAVGISLLNLIIIIVGILWINDAFQQAEENEEGVAETLRARIEILYAALQNVGGVLIVGVLVFAFAWLITSYNRASRKDLSHRQSAELNSYLNNLSRDRRRSRRTAERRRP